MYFKLSDFQYGIFKDEVLLGLERGSLSLLSRCSNHTYS